MSNGTIKYNKMVPFLFSMTFGGLCSHQLLWYGRPKFLYKHQWMYWPSLSCRVSSFASASKGQQDPRWSMVSVCLSHTLHFVIFCQHHFLICLLENFLLVGSNPVSLWWNPQRQISDLMNLATDRSVKNLDQVH